MTRQKRSSKVDMLEGDIPTIFRKLALPMMTGFIAMMIFNTVDTIYVGMLGGEELAALSFTFPVALIYMNIAFGLGIGASSVVSREIGAGNHEKGKKLTTYTIILAFFLSIAISIVGYFTIDPVFRLLGADDDILPLIRDYMKIWYLGISFLIIPIVGNTVIRATGDARSPMYIMLSAAVVNMAVDPLLIFGIGPFPRLELTGAAIATVVSRAATMVVTLYILVHREHLLELSRPRWSEMKECWKAVLHVGAPAALTNLLAPFSLAVITFLAATHGHEAVAAVGVGSRLDFIALLPVFGVSASLLPFVGQNIGAGEKERVREGVFMSVRFAAYWSFGVAVLLFLLSDVLGRAFTSDTQILKYLKLYLLFIPAAYGFRVAIDICVGYFNASGKPLPAASLNALRFLIVLVPLTVLGNHFLGYLGILLGVSVCGVISGIIGLLWLRNDVNSLFATTPDK